jgi:hypothetical protein
MKKDDIILLKNIKVLRWIYNDVNFLRGLKSEEDAWGKSLLTLLNYKKETNQWTTLIGERITKEILILLGYTDIKRPKILQNIKPDFETNTTMVETKTSTYFTTGTADEKIGNTPYKYRNIFQIYEKPLIILCIAHAELFAKKNNLIYKSYDDIDENAKSFHKLYESLHISFKAASDLLDFFILN